jgi:hypothetical protein
MLVSKMVRLILEFTDSGSTLACLNNEFCELKPLLKSEMLEVLEAKNAGLKQERDSDPSEEELPCDNTSSVENLSFQSKIDVYEKTSDYRWSPVWIWFKKVKKVKSDSNVPQSKCLICNKIVPRRTGSTSLMAKVNSMIKQTISDNLCGSRFQPAGRGVAIFKTQSLKGGDFLPPNMSADDWSLLGHRA